MHTIIYIDNDNIQYVKYESIFNSIFKDNNTFFKIFINKHDFSKINENAINKHKFIVCNNNGKNSLDISLTIECIKDLLNNKNIDKFVIVSNDSDFIPLCKEIKECGKQCELCVTRTPNKIINDVYDDVINIEDFCKENEINIKKNEVNKIFNEYFRINSNDKYISFDNIPNIFIQNNINYKKN